MPSKVGGVAGRGGHSDGFGFGAQLAFAIQARSSLGTVADRERLRRSLWWRMGYKFRFFKKYVQKRLDYYETYATMG